MICIRRSARRRRRFEVEAYKRRLVEYVGPQAEPEMRKGAGFTWRIFRIRIKPADHLSVPHASSGWSLHGEYDKRSDLELSCMCGCPMREVIEIGQQWGDRSFVLKFIIDRFGGIFLSCAPAPEV